MHNIHEPGELTTTLLQYTSRARVFLTQQYSQSPRLQHKFPHFAQQLLIQDTHVSPQLISQFLHAIHCEQQEYLAILPIPVTMSFDLPQPHHKLQSARPDHQPIPNQHKHHYPHPEWDFGSDTEESDDSQWSPDLQDPQPQTQTPHTYTRQTHPPTSNSKELG